ncbi:MAG: type II secretion system secretin GspD [Alphaproteobacteria bacterium]
MRGLVILFVAAVVVSVALSACADGPWGKGAATTADSAGITAAAEGRRTTEPASDASAATGSAIEAEAAAAPGVTQGLYPGTGVFIDPSAAARRAVAVTPEGDITINFADADVREVVRSLLGNILGANYVIDPMVDGTITVQTSRPLARSAVLPMLERILRANGAVLVDAGGMYEVLPIEEAPRTLVAPEARLPGFGLQIVPLRYVAAGEMQKLLAPLLPKGATLVVDAVRNVVMFSGTRRERASLIELIETFDIDWLAGMSFGLFPLDVTDPETLVEDLENVFGDQADGPLAGVIRLLPIERLNSILVVSTQPAYLEDARTWIERFDRVDQDAGPQLHVYYVQNGRAADLAVLLNDVFGERRADEAVARVAPGLEPVTMRARGAAGPGRAREGGAYVQGPRAQAPSETPGVAAEAGVPAPALPAETPAVAPTADEGIVIGGNSDIRVIADEANNALLILATPQQYRDIESTLRKLDIVPLQVLIEATIAEVTLKDDLKYGLQWFFRSSGHQFTLSEVAGGVLGGPAVGFSYIFSGSNSVQAVLNALAEITDVNVISSPQLMVLDNQTAEIQVGDQVPVAVQSAVTTLDPDAPIVNTIEYFDTGVILRVTPRVNAGGLVIMEIEQQVSDVVETTTSGIDSPTIQQRQIHSTVAIQSGETVALGGLITDRKEASTSGLPILSRIPVLGALFGSTTKLADRTELLVVITPRVVRNQQEAREVTAELRRRLRALSPLEQMVE